MNIWIINHFAYGPDQSAGTRHYSLAKALMSRGHQLLIVASSFYHKGRQEVRLMSGELYRRERLEEVPFQWIKTPPYKDNPVARLWNMLVFARRVLQRKWQFQDDLPDVVIGSSPSLLAALAALFLARKLHIPFVLEIRDFWPDSLRDVGAFSSLHPIYGVFKFIERYLYRQANIIVTLFQHSPEYIIANGGRADKIVWIPNGTDIQQKEPLPADNGQRPFTLIYFGAHGPYNGLEKLVEAAALLRSQSWTSASLRIVLLGDGPSKSDLMRQAKQKGVLGLIEFRAAVPKHSLWANIKDADAFLMIIKPMPSYEKGISPNKLWDYFAAARPVLFSTIGGEQMARDSGAGLAVSPGDAAALAGGIEQLCKMSAKARARMGQNGRRYVEENADIEQLALRLENALAQVITDSGKH